MFRAIALQRAVESLHFVLPVKVNFGGKGFGAVPIFVVPPNLRCDRLDLLILALLL